MNGNLIILEGPDGVGKTTMSKELVSRWQKAGVPAMYYAFPGRDAGTLGELVYRLHHGDTAIGVSGVSPVSLQTLHIAAHLDAIDRVIRPALEQGKWVVLDRYWWSTWVYGTKSGIDPKLLEALISVEQIYWGGITPAVAFLITRQEPLRVETSVERWGALSRLYDDIAAREEIVYPVVRVPNERALELVSATLSQSAERIIGGSERSKT